MSKKVTRIKRALHPDDKHLKSEHIIDVASKLLDKKAYSKITMDEVASKAKMAKGTLYLYFKTKEELYLSVYLRMVQVSTRQQVDFLSSKPKVTPEEFCDFVALHVPENRSLFMLVAEMPALMAQKVSKSLMADHQRVTIEIYQSLVGAMVKSSLLPGPKEASIFLIQFGALIRGLWPYETSSPSVKTSVIGSFSDLLTCSLLKILHSAD